MLALQKTIYRDHESNHDCDRDPDLNHDHDRCCEFDHAQDSKPE